MADDSRGKHSIFYLRRTALELCVSSYITPGAGELEEWYKGKW